MCAFFGLFSMSFFLSAERVAPLRGGDHRAHHDNEVAVIDKPGMANRALARPVPSVAFDAMFVHIRPYMPYRVSTAAVGIVETHTVKLIRRLRISTVDIVPF